MKVLSIFNQKGGTGKSTITILLACALASEGKEVAILDCDTQRTILSLSEYEEDKIVSIFQCKPNDVSLMLEQLEEVGCDYCFIDMPRYTKTDKTILRALASTDIVFVPCLGGMIEILSTSIFVEGLKNIQENFYCFVNRMSRKNEDLETIKILKKSCNVLDNHLKDLKIFRNPSLSKSLLSTKEGKARFKLFYDEIKMLINKI